MSEWQSIKTLPLMKEVIVFHPEFRPRIGKKGPKVLLAFTGSYPQEYEQDGYTHWMPLPAPPK